MTEPRRLYLPLISLAGVLLMPLMSVPIMPSDYRPVGALLLFIPAMLYMIDYMAGHHVRKDELLLLLFMLVSTLQAAVMTGMDGLGWGAVARGLLPLLLGIACYLAMRRLLERELMRTVAALTTSMQVICILGLVELFAMAGVLPGAIKTVIGTVFSGIVNTRLQLTTQEASWAVRLLVFAVPLFVYAYRQTRRKKYLLLSTAASGMFLFAFSLDGIFILLIAALLYFLLSKPIRPAQVLRMVGYVGGAVGVIALVFYVLLTFQGDSYYIGRLAGVADHLELDPELVAVFDGSTFIRAFYPIIALRTFLDHPFGVGPGNFPYFFNYYIEHDYRFALTLVPEVAANFNEMTGSPKSLYTRLLAEHGLISGWFFVAFLWWHVRRVVALCRKGLTPLAVLNAQLFVVALASVIQFASFAYMFMWFSLALNAALAQKLGVPAALEGQAAAAPDFS